MIWNEAEPWESIFLTCLYT